MSEPITRPRDPFCATAKMDGVVRTHDEARDVIRHAAPGAIVTFYPFHERDCKTHESKGIRADGRGYDVVLERFGKRYVSERDVYFLPLLREGLASRVRSLVQYADAASRYAKG